MGHNDLRVGLGRDDGPGLALGVPGWHMSTQPEATGRDRFDVFHEGLVLDCGTPPCTFHTAYMHAPHAIFMPALEGLHKAPPQETGPLLPVPLIHFHSPLLVHAAAVPHACCQRKRVRHTQPFVWHSWLCGPFSHSPAAPARHHPVSTHEAAATLAATAAAACHFHHFSTGSESVCRPWAQARGAASHCRAERGAWLGGCFTPYLMPCLSACALHARCACYSVWIAPKHHISCLFCKSLY